PNGSPARAHSENRPSRPDSLGLSRAAAWLRKRPADHRTRVREQGPGMGTPRLGNACSTPRYQTVAKHVSCLNVKSLRACGTPPRTLDTVFVFGTPSRGSERC